MLDCHRSAFFFQSMKLSIGPNGFASVMSVIIIMDEEYII